MANRAFLDTNVLVYMYDRGAPAKRATARQLVRRGIESGTLVISVQVLGEFSSTVTKRIPNPLSTKEAVQEINRIAVLPVLGIDAALVRRGIYTHKRYGIAHWDALSRHRRTGGMHADLLGRPESRPVVQRNRCRESLLNA